MFLHNRKCLGKQLLTKPRKENPSKRSKKIVQENQPTQSEVSIFDAHDHDRDNEVDTEFVLWTEM